MKKRNYMEIVGVLSLSLVLTSALSVSSCLPEMLNTFSNHSRSSIELLMSVPAFAMMIIIASSPMLLKYMNERTMITSGLLIYGIAGMIPIFFTSYGIILVSRILMGIGIGLINTKAVSMIGERFTGNLQQRLQGMRCSMETLGQATLTLIAGQLLGIKWNYAFVIYGIAFVILFIYLKFVPASTVQPSVNNESKKVGYKIGLSEWIIIFQNAVLGGILVCSSVSNSLRIASYVTEKGIGTAVNGATILSLATFVGFLSGLIFGNLIKTLRRFTLPFSMCIGAIGFAIIAFANNLIVVAVGASISSFSVTIGTSFIFNRLSTRLPVRALDTGNSIVLVGCNLGSFIAPFVLQAVNVVSIELSAGFLAYALLYLIIAIVAFVRSIYNMK